MLGFLEPFRSYQCLASHSEIWGRVLRPSHRIGFLLFLKVSSRSWLIYLSRVNAR